MARATSEGTSVIVRLEHNHPTGEEALQVEKAISNLASYSTFFFCLGRVGSVNSVN